MAVVRNVSSAFASDADGTDTVSNMETLRFDDEDVDVRDFIDGVGEVVRLQAEDATLSGGFAVENNNNADGQLIRINGGNGVLCEGTDFTARFKFQLFQKARTCACMKIGNANKLDHENLFPRSATMGSGRLCCQLLI